MGHYQTLNKVCKSNPELRKDKKIIADLAFCKEIDILLTTDRNLADINIPTLEIFTPKRLFKYLSKILEVRDVK